MSEKEKVEGYVEHIIFRNEENGYTVLNLSMKGRELTCVGTLPMIGEGELIEASGDYTQAAPDTPSGQSILQSILLSLLPDSFPYGSPFISNCQ